MSKHFDTWWKSTSEEEHWNKSVHQIARDAFAAGRDSVNVPTSDLGGRLRQAERERNKRFANALVDRDLLLEAANEIDRLAAIFNQKRRPSAWIRHYSGYSEFLWPEDWAVKNEDEAYRNGWTPLFKKGS